jgi:hypothetical protein
MKGTDDIKIDESRKISENASNIWNTSLRVAASPDIAKPKRKRQFPVEEIESEKQKNQETPYPGSLIFEIPAALEPTVAEIQKLDRSELAILKDTLEEEDHFAGTFGSNFNSILDLVQRKSAPKDLNKNKLCFSAQTIFNIQDKIHKKLPQSIAEKLDLMPSPLKTLG